MLAWYSLVHLAASELPDAVTALARKHQIKVLEDCAQSMGASYKGRPVGSMGDVGIYSLQLNKTITAGDGLFNFFYKSPETICFWRSDLNETLVRRKCRNDLS